MWLICGIISVAFCATAWIMAAKKNVKASWATACSLAFTALTLLMEYRMVSNWVSKEDWSALLDVVPSMFPMLVSYVTIMILANIVSIAIEKRQR